MLEEPGGEVPGELHGPGLELVKGREGLGIVGREHPVEEGAGVLVELLAEVFAGGYGRVNLRAGKSPGIRHGRIPPGDGRTDHAEGARRS